MGTEHGTAILIRQVKYVHTLLDQEHCGVQRITRRMLGVKSVDTAQ